MKAILDLDGWRKEIDVNAGAMRYGRIWYSFLPPPLLTISKNPRINEDHAPVVCFYHSGFDEGGFPVFKSS